MESKLAFFQAQAVLLFSSDWPLDFVGILGPIHQGPNSNFQQ